jgi:hypothetical protein
MIPPVSPHHPGVPTAAARQGFPQEWAICHLQELATASEGGTDGRYQRGRCDLAAVAAAGQDQAGDGAVEEWRRLLISKRVGSFAPVAGP